MLRPRPRIVDASAIVEAPAYSNAVEITASQVVAGGPSDIRHTSAGDRGHSGTAQQSWKGVAAISTQPARLCRQDNARHKDDRGQQCIASSLRTDSTGWCSQVWGHSSGGQNLDCSGMRGPAYVWSAAQRVSVASSTLQTRQMQTGRTQPKGAACHWEASAIRAGRFFSASSTSSQCRTTVIFSCCILHAHAVLSAPASQQTHFYRAPLLRRKQEADQKPTATIAFVIQPLQLLQNTTQGGHCCSPQRPLQFHLWWD